MATASVPFLDLDPTPLPATSQPAATAPDPGALEVTTLLGGDFDRAFRRAVDEEGLLGEALCHHFRVCGSLSRARLALDAADVLGLSREVAVAFAVACELLHNASLVHDDLQDRDATRRGQPSVWARFGDDVAVNVGDYLLTKSFEVAAEAPIDPAHALAVLEVFTHATTSLIRGQIADDTCYEQSDLDLIRFQEIARDKTGPLIALPVQAALAAAGRVSSEGAAVAEAFESLGVVYQIQDDIADLMRRKERVAGSDVRAGRPNVVVALHRELVDDRIVGRVEAARALTLSRPDVLESLISELSRSPAVDHAFYFAEQVGEHARHRAQALTPELMPVFERCATRLNAPLEQLRFLHAELRTARAIQSGAETVAIDVHSRAEAIPVHA